MSSKNSNIVAIVTMCFIFAMISFVTNMGAPFGNIWGYTYPWAAMMGNMMNFAAYLFMGIPAGNMLVRFGYKKTALIALAVGVVGLATQYLSSVYGGDVEAFILPDIMASFFQTPWCAGQVVALNLIIYLLGAFICGFCVCMLNTVVNPMLNILGGGGNRGNQYIQIGGTLNSFTGLSTPLLVGILVGTVSENTSMGDVAPLLFIGMAVFAISFLIIAKVSIPEPQSEVKEKVGVLSPLKFRHTALGVLAIFFYVGVEIGIPAQLNFYISSMTFEGAATIGGSLASAYWFMMLIGRFSSTLISGKVSTRVQMTVVSALGIVLLLISIFMPESIAFNYDGNSIPFKCVTILLCGLCTSVMWGGIFNLSVEGLGKYTAAASGLFMTMVVGGGIMPLLQDMIAKAYDPITSYWLVIAMIAYILYYSLIGCKPANK